MKFTKEQISIIELASDILTTYLNVGIVSLSEYLDEDYEVIDSPLIYDDDDSDFIEYDDGTFGYDLVANIGDSQIDEYLAIEHFEDLFNYIYGVVVNIDKNKNVLGFYVITDDAQLYISEYGITVFEDESEIVDEE